MEQLNAIGRATIPAQRSHRTGLRRLSTLAKNFSWPGGTPLQSSRTVCFEALVKSGRVGGNVYGFTRAHDRLLTAESSFDLAFENRKRFLEIVSVRTWASAGRDEHINQAIAAIGVVARQ